MIIMPSLTVCKYRYNFVFYWTNVPVNLHENREICFFTQLIIIRKHIFLIDIKFDRKAREKWKNMNLKSKILVLCIN